MEPVEVARAQLGRYDLIRRIGAGGMGVVWEARERSTHARVALKILRDDDPDAIYRFKYEFRALCQLSTHRNLLRYHELVEDWGLWFFTMDLLEDAQDFITYIQGVPAPEETTSVHGPSDVLRWTPTKLLTVEESERYRPDRFQRGPPVPTHGIDFDRLRAAVLQLCEGTAYLHRFHRLHRDLKPSNVLVTSAGRVVLLDFGLVAEVEPGQQLTIRHAVRGASQDFVSDIMGTYDYMAPEQAAGWRLSPACDWYAVGVILFRALTGELPFRGHPKAVVSWKQDHDAPSPTEIRSGLPEDLVSLCRSLLRREPAERPDGETILGLLRGAAPVPGPAADAASFASRQQVFIGRVAQLSSLTEALAAARDGATVVCHLVGASGTGKSTLMDRFLAQARADGVLVLKGRCYEGESVTYKAVDAVIDALTKFLLSLESEAVRAILPDGTEALARMFPILKRVPTIRLSVQDTAASSDPRASRKTAYRTLAALLTNISATSSVLLAIDDLQWTDADSVSLLTALLEGGAPPPMLCLFAYRTEELVARPLLRALSRFPQRLDQRVARRDLVVSGLSDVEAEALAKALLPGDAPDQDALCRWIARESQGSALFVHELVRHLAAAKGGRSNVDLDAAIWSRVALLPEATLRLISVIAIASRPIRLDDLHRALGSGALPISDLAHLRDEHLVDLEGTRPDCLVQMAHDRIRETVSRHIDAETTRLRHLDVGAALEFGGLASAVELADHFFLGGDRDRACHYSLQAARDAVRQLAFEHAETCLVRARAIAQSLPQQMRAAEQHIHLCTDMARFEDAYAVAVDAASSIGLRLPRRFSAPLFVRDWALLSWSKRTLSIMDLQSLPVATDPSHIAAIRLLNAVMKAAYQIKPPLCVWLAIRALRMCLAKGNTPDCAIAYMVFGCIFTGGIRGRYQAGFEFGQLAMQLVDQFTNAAQRAEVLFVVGYFGTAWRRPAVAAETLWERALESGMECGDKFHTGCAAAGIATSLFSRGRELEAVNVRIRGLRKTLKSARLDEPLGVLTAVEQATKNLRGLTIDPASFSDQQVDERAFETQLAKFGSRHFAHWYWILRMECLYLWDRIAPAAAAARISATYLADSRGMFQEAEHAFYASLIALAAIRRRIADSPSADRKSALRNFRQLSSWSAGCADNFRAREAIVAGDIARTFGRTAKAVSLFTDAAAAAVESDLPHLHGMALMLRSQAHRALHDAVNCKIDLDAAAACYRHWGASGIAALLQGGSAGGPPPLDAQAAAPALTT